MTILTNTVTTRNSSDNQILAGLLAIGVVFTAAIAIGVGIHESRASKKGTEAFKKEDMVHLIDVRHSSSRHGGGADYAYFDTDGDHGTYEYFGQLSSKKVDRSTVGSKKSGATWLQDMDMKIYKAKGNVPR